MVEWKVSLLLGENAQCRIDYVDEVSLEPLIYVAQLADAELSAAT